MTFETKEGTFPPPPFGGSREERVTGQAVSRFPIPLRCQFGAMETRISSAKAPRDR